MNTNKAYQRKYSSMGAGTVTLLSVAMCGSAVAQPGEWCLEELGHAGYARTVARAINEDGCVAGNSWRDSGAYGRAFWNCDGPDWESTRSDAFDINGAGYVVGYVGNPNNPTVWHEGTRSTLNHSGYEHGRALTVNEVGDIAGSVRQNQLDFEPSYWFSDGEGGWSVRFPLAAPGGDLPYARPWAMNDSGIIVGAANDLDGRYVPVMWESFGAPVLLDLGQYSSGYARGVNEDGIIVGHVSDGESTYAARWVDGQLEELGFEGSCSGIRDDGVIVGRYTDLEDESEWPFVWIDGEMRSLRTTLQAFDDRYTRARAVDINAAGVIAAWAERPGGGGNPAKRFAFRISPRCSLDLDCSGTTDFGDILAVLAAWGQQGGAEDLDGSGAVDFGDILRILAAWGTCE